MGKYHRHRRGNGQFRRGTLQDIGMATCNKCNKIFRPDYSDLQYPISPMEMRDRSKFCGECGGKGEPVFNIQEEK